MFIAIKTDDGEIKGKISFYCRVLNVSRQAFHKYLKTKEAPWKYQALQFKQPEGVHIPSERTVYRVMEEIGLNHKLKRVLPKQIKKLENQMI